jgi:hypothetical protein
LLGNRQVIDHHAGGSNDFGSPPVTALKNGEDGVVWLSRIMTLRKRFLLVRVEWFPDDFIALNAMLAEQLL